MARRFRWSMLALIVAAVWVVGAGAAVEAQPGRYSKSPDGVILDSVTGLEWYINPNRDNTWNEAKAWADNLTVAGGGWRLPTLAELKAQYRKGASAVNMDPLFQLPGAYVWSGDLKIPSSPGVLPSTAAWRASTASSTALAGWPWRCVPANDRGPWGYRSRLSPPEAISPYSGRDFPPSFFDCGG